MDDKQIIKDQIGGLKNRLSQLRATEKIFIRAQGIDEQVERTRGEVEKLGIDIQSDKETLSEMKAKKNDLIKGISQKAEAAIAKHLAYGEPSVIIEDGHVDIGWIIDGKRRPAAGLSGGERVAFDTAMAAALGADVIVVEAAELDDDSLIKLLAKLSESRAQTIVSTCHSNWPEHPNSSFNVVNFE